MEHYEDFIKILDEELVPALGCTEPIAIAYAAARAAKLVKGMPDSVLVRCSGNIIKNVKCVVVPNSGGMIGVKAAAIIGAIGGDDTLGLNVLERVTDAQIHRAKALEPTDYCKVELLDSDAALHIFVDARRGADVASVEVLNLHDNIVKTTLNGNVLFEKTAELDKYCGALTDREFLTFDNIYEFAETVRLEDVKELIARQIAYNYAIAQEGMTGNYGVGIGVNCLKHYGPGIYHKMRAYTAAASEARMCGCTMPVVTNSGSGNQGIASSVPLIVYAKEMSLPDSKLYRALVFSNLITIYQKTFIGRLSAFCGAISATCAGIAGVCYIQGHPKDTVRMTINNTLANDIGVICDGAKASCAAKISCGFDSALTAYFLAIENRSYSANSGILKDTLDRTIKCVGRMAAKGMYATDKEILSIMLED